MDLQNNSGFQHSGAAFSLPADRYAAQNPELLKGFAASFARPDSGKPGALRETAEKNNIPILRPDAAAGIVLFA